MLGLSAFASAFHGYLLHGWHEQNKRQSLSHFIGLGVINGLGCLMYAARVPERLLPGAFDVFGASHHFLHIMVMFGAYSHSVGLQKALAYWQGTTTAQT